MLGIGSGMNATLDFVYAAPALPPQVELERLATGESKTLADMPSGAFRSVPANSAAIDSLIESGTMIAIELTLTRIISLVADVLSEQARIAARAKAPAEPDFRRLNEAEFPLERRIVTLS